MKDLLYAVSLFHLCLATALQIAIKAFIEPPAFASRNPHQVHLVEEYPEGPDCPFHDGGIGHVEDKACVAHKASRNFCLQHSLFREVDIHPACEPSFLVPEALAMSEQN